MRPTCGRTRSTVVANGGAAAVARAAGFESAMTQQWYTTAATETSHRMKIRALGHVSLFVRDLEATRRFYRDLLGLTETGTGKDGRIVFFSAGARHHDLSCELARAAGPGPQPKGVPGLYHVAFEVGETADDLAAARRDVEARGLTPFGEYANGFCVRDPDGHEVELYVEPPGTRQRSSTPASGATTTQPNAAR
jgi:catechol 2,3-dioxygenase